MAHSRIHLIAPAGNCRSFLETLGVSSGGAFIDLVTKAVGGGYEVTGDVELMFAEEDELRGGRTDDLRRAADIHAALSDDDIRAIVAVRGGAWFTRVLPWIDLTGLRRRKTPVFVFGFSELTTLVNIVSEYDYAFGVLDMGPAFLTYGLRRYAMRHPEVLTHASSPCVERTSSSFAHRLETGATQNGTTPCGTTPYGVTKDLDRPLMERATAKQWMQARLMPEFEAYWQRVVAMIEGRGSSMRLRARHFRGPEPDDGWVRFVGGNLTVLSTLIGSRYESCVAPEGRWLVLEDFNDKPERLDRFLAHLTLARYWERCGGVLLGDFHQDERDLNDAVLAMLEYHLPPGCEVPVLVTSTVGHIWPMTPLPLNRPLEMRRIGVEMYEIECRMTKDK